MTKTRRAQRRRNLLGIRLITFAILSLLVVASFGKMKLRQKSEAYQKQEELLTARLEDEKARSREIEELAKYVQTKKYVEEVAKERLGLVYKDEILFKATE